MTGAGGSGGIVFCGERPLLRTTDSAACVTECWTRSARPQHRRRMRMKTGERRRDPAAEGRPLIGFLVEQVDGGEDKEGLGLPDRGDWRHVRTFETFFGDGGVARSGLAVFKWPDDPSDEDSRSVLSVPQSLREHAEQVAEHARALAIRLELPEDEAEALVTAARLHDDGKEAERWQNAMNAPDDGRPYAKTRGGGNPRLLEGYRHEFGSLLKAEERDLPSDTRDLVLHLIAAHHGYARPTISPAGCEAGPPSALESKAGDAALRFARLQKRYGPWGLAWREAILRAADQSASGAWSKRHGKDREKDRHGLSPTFRWICSTRGRCSPASASWRRRMSCLVRPRRHSTGATAGRPRSAWRRRTTSRPSRASCDSWRKPRSSPECRRGRRTSSAGRRAGARCPKSIVRGARSRFPIRIPPRRFRSCCETTRATRFALDYWGDATRRDNVKFWAGAAGYPGAAIVRDALAISKGKTRQHATDPFALSNPQSNSFRFDWRRDYIPAQDGFSPNRHGKNVQMVGFPLVELLAAIGVSNASAASGGQARIPVRRARNRPRSARGFHVSPRGARSGENAYSGPSISSFRHAPGLAGTSGPGPVHHASHRRGVANGHGAFERPGSMRSPTIRTDRWHCISVNLCCRSKVPAR